MNTPAAIALIICLSLSAFSVQAQGAPPIRIGEINSYKAQAAFLEPYRKGMDLALEEVNASGGVLGRKLQVIYRDDNASPADAVRAAEELLSAEKVDVLAGTFLSHVGLAVSDLARQRKVLFLASEPLTDKLVWQQGHRYTFRLRPSTYMQVDMLIAEAVALKRKRWALVYPNYEYGQSAIASFKSRLKALQPEVEFVAEQATPLGKLDAGPVVQALVEAKADAIFNVLFGADLAKFVREGSNRGLFEKTPVVSLLTGEPEYLDPLRAEAPVGWIVTGYPWYAIDTAAHKRFAEAYQQRYKDYPRLGSVVGYSTIKALAAGLKAAGSADTEKLVNAMQGLEFETPFGAARFRAIDHQSTMGAYVGRIAVQSGKGVMQQIRYADGAKHLPGDDQVRQLRPKP